MSDGRPRLGDLLVDLGFIDEAQLDVALAKQRGEGGRLGKILVESAVITEDRLVHALARQLGIDSCDPVMTPIHPKVLELIPKSVAYRHRVLSLARKRENDSEVIYVAMADPLDTQAMEAVRQHLGPNVRLHWMLAGETEMELALEKHLGAPAPTSEPAASAPEASTYQGVPVVQGLPLGRDLPPRRPSAAASAPPAAQPEPFAPLAPGAELSATGSIDQAFQGAFAEGPDEEIPAEAFEEVDPFEDEDDAHGADAGAPRLPTSDLEVLAEDEAPEEHELEPIPLDRFSDRTDDDADDAEPGLQTLEGEAIEALPEDADDEPDGISEPFAERPPAFPPPVASAAPRAPAGLAPDDGALPPLGPFPSEPLGDAARAAPARETGLEAAEPSAPPAPVGPPATSAGSPTWGDLLGGDAAPRPDVEPEPTTSASNPPMPPDVADAAEAPTPPPDLEALDAVEVEPAENEPLDDGAAGSMPRDPAPVPLAPGELTERPELEVESEVDPERGPAFDRDAADPSAPTRDVEADDPVVADAVAEDAAAGPVVEAETAPAAASVDADGAGDTRPLDPVDEAAPEAPGTADGSGTEELHIRPEASPDADDAELEPSPWSDRDTTAGLELDPAPAEPPTAPSGAGLAEAASTDDVSDRPNGSDGPQADPDSADRLEGVGLGPRLDRFLKGPGDPAEVAWWTRMLLEILRDADLLTDARLERAASRLDGSAEPPSP